MMAHRHHPTRVHHLHQTDITRTTLNPHKITHILPILRTSVPLGLDFPSGDARVADGAVVAEVASEEVHSLPGVDGATTSI